MSDVPSSDASPGGNAPGEASLRTILILDLVNREALIEQLGALRAADLIRRHDRLVRDLMRRHGGREIDSAADQALSAESDTSQPVQNKKEHHNGTHR